MDLAKANCHGDIMFEYLMIDASPKYEVANLMGDCSNRSITMFHRWEGPR